MAKKKLSKADEFYVNGHPEKTVEELSADLGVPEGLIEAFKQPVAEPQPTKLAKRSGKNFPAYNKGSTIMTRTASKAGEGGLQQVSLKKALMNDPDITIIDPDEEVC